MYTDTYFVIDCNNQIIEEFDTKSEAQAFVKRKARYGYNYTITNCPYEL